jgi:hypothetical protein
MKITVTLPVASDNLSLEKLAEVIGYAPTRLVEKGRDRIPPRNLPKLNGWNGGLVLVNEPETDVAARKCLDQYPQIADRVRLLRQISPDIECRMYFGLRPFSRDFILLFEDETLKRIGELSCQVSIEYFDESS